MKHDSPINLIIVTGYIKMASEFILSSPTKNLNNEKKTSDVT
jgi:hypothetical protein